MAVSCGVVVVVVAGVEDFDVDGAGAGACRGCKAAAGFPACGESGPAAATAVFFAGRKGVGFADGGVRGLPDVGGLSAFVGGFAPAACGGGPAAEAVKGPALAAAFCVSAAAGGAGGGGGGGELAAWLDLDVSETDCRFGWVGFSLTFPAHGCSVFRESPSMSSLLPGVAGSAASPDGTGARARLSTFFFRINSAFASSVVIWAPTPGVAAEELGRPRLTSCLVFFD